MNPASVRRIFFAAQVSFGTLSESMVSESRLTKSFIIEYVQDNRRPFYIIAHNPDSMKEAAQAIKDGANSLEPDVCFDGKSWDDFNVRDRWTFAPGFLSKVVYSDPPLRLYLRALVEILRAHPENNFSLLAFDLKQPFHHDINKFFQVISEEFCPHFPEVSIMTTVGVPRGMKMLTRRQRVGTDEAIGIDEGISSGRAERFFKRVPIPFVYGIGTSVPFIPTTMYLPRIKKALKRRDAGGSFSLVYPWTVNSEYSLRKFLDLESGVDGIITDNVKLLKRLVESERYSMRFRLATAEDKPFRLRSGEKSH